ncbi:MAG: dihydrolipoyl dehydrogenase [Pseudomonadota bacterium]
MSSSKYDIAVIGGGPGGYVAAIRAAQLGLKAVVIEKEHLGGICLNWGCIPTKALLRSAEIYSYIQHADQYGITVKDAKFDLHKIVDRSRKISKQLSSGISHLMKKNKIDVVMGTAKLSSTKAISVQTNDKSTSEIKADNIIIATGARARQLPNLETDGKLIWSYREAMVPDKMPKKLLIIGSGAIGIEFASFYNSLGMDVTVAEVQERILPVEDAEISELAKKSFEKQGIKIKTKAIVKSFKKKADNVDVTISLNGKDKVENFDRVIMAVGVVGNTENIGLEKTKIKIEKGHIATNEWMCTDEPNIFAIGDVTAPPWLAHKASHEAILAVEKIKGLPNLKPIKKENIPGCTYCHPQIASIGLTEAKAKELGNKIKVGRFPFIGNGKAIALGETEGLIKTIFAEETGELLGAHLIGAEVTELINNFALGKTMEATELDFMHTIFPHPTLSEMLHESVLDAYKKAVHI